MAAAPITIKKRKKTIKKAVSASSDATASSPTEAPPPPAPQSTPPAGMDMPPAFQAPVSVVTRGSSLANTIFGTLAIISALCFVVLLVMQWTEWNDLRGSFPRPIETERIIDPAL